MKKRLNNVTLIAVDTANPAKAAASMFRSLKEIEVDRAVLLTNVDMKFSGIDVVQVPAITSKDEYSRFALKELHKYVDTGFALVVQWDSWVLNGQLFDDRLYEYDYAGALWLETDGLSNGNGGYSWRSKRLMETFANDPICELTKPEDVALCRIYRRYLEHQYGMRWAPDEICEQFSFECMEPVQKTFGFHSFFHPPYKECVVVKRDAACGDVVQVEPVLRQLHEQGYRVFLDTLPQFWFLFANHDFPVEHFSNINPRMPYKLVDLNLVYENQPDQLHLKSYYEAAGIPDAPIRNPKLSFKITEQNKLFKKYVTLHIDQRQPYRSIYGVNWESVVTNLKDKGYDVIQVGEGQSEDVKGALRMKAATLNLLEYIIAGADAHIGIDSGPSNIALGFDKPMVIFHGSVSPDVIYPDASKVKVVTNHNAEKPICDTPYCWSSVVGGCEGVGCYIDAQRPPCTQYQTAQVIQAINEIL